MGASESKRKLRKLIKSKTPIGTQQLEEIWETCGGGEESIDKEQMKPLLFEIAKRMNVEVTPERVEDWIEECRSTQAKYASDKINFLHFKRLYLAIIHDGGVLNELPLTMSLQMLVPSCKTNVFGVPPSDSTIRTHRLAILPKFLEDVCNILNQPKFCHQEGLYRVPGFERKIQAQIQQIDMGMEGIELTDAPDLCGLLVKFFKYLPNSFFGAHWMKTATLKDIGDPMVKREKFAEIVSQLPSANREILACLANHFAIIEANQAYNKMTRENLNTVFAYLGPGVLNLLLDFANDPEVFKSTVKYGITITESAIRSENLPIPSPIAELIPFLDGFAGMSPELYNHPKGSLFEIRVREIIYQLNNNEELNLKGKEDVVPASIAFARFLRTTKDSLWDRFEAELVASVNDKDTFCAAFHKLSHTHAACCLAIAKHIQGLARHHHTIEDWCNRFSIYHFNIIMPALIRYIL